jgi:hypothetical protein
MDFHLFFKKKMGVPEMCGASYIAKVKEMTNFFDKLGMSFSCANHQHDPPPITLLFQRPAVCFNCDDYTYCLC